MLRSEKGEALVAVLLLAALIFIVGTAAVAMGTSVRKTAAYEVRQKKAYYIAEAGVEKVLAYIDENQEWFENEVPPGEQNPVIPGQDYGDGRIVSGGFTKLEDVGTGAKISIESVGAVKSSEPSEWVTRKVTAEALVTTPADLLRGLAVLPDMSGNFTLNGSLNFEGGEDGGATMIWNGSVNFGSGVRLKHVGVYASANITVPDKQAGNSGGSKVVDVSVYEDYSYVPAYPVIDADSHYRTSAQYVYDGDTTFEGSLPKGIVFVDGSVTISPSKRSDPSYYTGHTIIVATGDITIEGDLVEKPPGSGSVLVLMAPSGTVSLKGQGNAYVDAFIIARAITNLQGTQTIEGGVLTKDLDFQGGGSGNVTIKANPKKLLRLVAETNFLQGIRLSVKLTSWREGAAGT